MLIALILTNIVWAIGFLFMANYYASGTLAVKEFFLNQLDLAMVECKRINAEMLDRWKKDIAERDKRLVDRDKQWQDYTATLTGKKGEA